MEEDEEQEMGKEQLAMGCVVGEINFREYLDKGWLKRTRIWRFYESAFYGRDAFMSKSCKILKYKNRTFSFCRKPDISILL